MRVVMICDLEGNISGLISAPRSGARPSVPIPPGHQEVVLDIADLSDDSPDIDIEAKFAEVTERFKVDVKAKALRER
jgi:hypothetical protein